MAKGSKAQQHLNGLFGVVLAGGRSSRMGSDKALLAFKGGTLLEYQCKKMSSVVGIENVIVSGNYPSFKHVRDETPELGPLGGICSVVRSHGLAEYFLFLPVDMPKLRGETLLQLIREAQQDTVNSGWAFRASEMPLLLKNNAELDKVLTKLILQPRNFRSVRTLCSLIKYKLLDPCENLSAEFANANTPGEWKEAMDEHTC